MHSDVSNTEGEKWLKQGMVDGSASKSALRQDTGFWGLFNASVTQIWFKRCFNIHNDKGLEEQDYKNYVC